MKHALESHLSLLVWQHLPAFATLVALENKHNLDLLMSQVERTGFGSSVKLINADSNTALRSCGLEEEVRDTVLDDSSPAARWSLAPCDGADTWFAVHPSSDNAEVQLICLDMHRYACCLNRD